MIIETLEKKFVGKEIIRCIDDIQEMIKPKQLSIIHSARDNIDRETKRINCVIDEDSVITKFMYG